MLAAILLLWRWASGRSSPSSGAGQSCIRAIDVEQRALIRWALAYAGVTLAAGSIGMAGIAAGSMLAPFLHLLALSALTLTASLLFGIAAAFAGLERLEPHDRGAPPLD
jgi:hypothetical protein